MSNIVASSHNLTSIKLEDIQNFSLFTIAVSTFFSYLYYNFSSPLFAAGGDFTKPFHLLLPIVGLHAFVDFFLTKSYDLKMHHLCIIGVIFYNYYYNVSPEYRFIFLYPLLKTEISSIFYVLKYWLPKKTIIYHANTVLFFLSFLKLRVYDFYYEVIYNHSTFDIVFQKYSQSNYYLSGILLISCYGLFILNLYWFLIMNKILYKTITKIVNINTDKLCHLLSCYLHWINIPVAYYVYAYNPNEKYIFDMIGITALSISSYKYHYDVYRRLYDKQIEEYYIPNKENIVLFLNDNIAINLRSFLVIVTNYYNNQYLLPVLFISGVFHASSMYYCIVNMLELFIDSHKTKDEFLNCHNVISAIPIACDVFLIFINSSTEISIPFLLVNILIGLLFLVEPFYKLTHVAFHILLISQNYYMSLSSSR